MARKPVLVGGKRDEILDTAMKLFFENGYEATSVRLIMSEVGGEIGMFYHYFKSKEELFDRVTDRFFTGYEAKFGELISSCTSPEDFADRFLPLFSGSMGEFARLRDNMHWTIQYAMSGKTIFALKPAVADAISRWGINTDVPLDILAGQLLYGISATIHSEDFAKMSEEEKKNCIRQFFCRMIGPYSS